MSFYHKVDNRHTLNVLLICIFVYKKNVVIDRVTVIMISKKIIYLCKKYNVGWDAILFCTVCPSSLVHLDGVNPYIKRKRLFIYKVEDVGTTLCCPIYKKTG